MIAVIGIIWAPWSMRRRTRWSTRVEKDLREGRFHAVVEALEAPCQGRRGKAMREVVKYFADNEERMHYRAFRRKKIHTKNFIEIAKGPLPPGFSDKATITVLGPPLKLLGVAP